MESALKWAAVALGVVWLSWAMLGDVPGERSVLPRPLSITDPTLCEDALKRRATFIEGYNTPGIPKSTWATVWGFSELGHDRLHARIDSLGDEREEILAYNAMGTTAQLKKDQDLASVDEWRKIAGVIHGLGENIERHCGQWP